MKILPFFVVVLWICLHNSACRNPFYDPSLEVHYPDTIVQVNSLTPQVCEVKITNADSVYDITSYWTDKVTGRIIYKMSYSPYLNGRLHGIRMLFDDKGDTMLLAHFDQGVRVDSTVYKYPNGQVKQKFFYSKEQNVIFYFFDS